MDNVSIHMHAPELFVLPVYSQHLFEHLLITRGCSVRNLPLIYRYQDRPCHSPKMSDLGEQNPPRVRGKAMWEELGRTAHILATMEANGYIEAGTTDLLHAVSK